MPSPSQSSFSEYHSFVFPFAILGVDLADDTALKRNQHRNKWCSLVRLPSVHRAKEDGMAYLYDWIFLHHFHSSKLGW